jgi:hypothetical protein
MSETTLTLDALTSIKAKQQATWSGSGRDPEASGAAEAPAVGQPDRTDWRVLAGAGPVALLSEPSGRPRRHRYVRRRLGPAAATETPAIAEYLLVRLRLLPTTFALLWRAGTRRTVRPL